MIAGGAQVEDLGGPTPENYRPDDDSATKDPGASLGKAPFLLLKAQLLKKK